MSLLQLPHVDIEIIELEPNNFYHVKFTREGSLRLELFLSKQELVTVTRFFLDRCMLP